MVQYLPFDLCARTAVPAHTDNAPDPKTFTSAHSATSRMRRRNSRRRFIPMWAGGTISCYLAFRLAKVRPFAAIDENPVFLTYLKHASLIRECRRIALEYSLITLLSMLIIRFFNVYIPFGGASDFAVFAVLWTTICHQFIWNDDVFTNPLFDATSHISIMLRASPMRTSTIARGIWASAAFPRHAASHWSAVIIGLPLSIATFYAISGILNNAIASECAIAVSFFYYLSVGAHVSNPLIDIFPCVRSAELRLATSPSSRTAARHRRGKVFAAMLFAGSLLEIINRMVLSFLYLDWQSPLHLSKQLCGWAACGMMIGMVHGTASYRRCIVGYRELLHRVRQYNKCLG